jgi:hypothetical protein
VQRTSLSQLVFLHLLLSRCLQLIVRSSPQNGKGRRLFNLSWIILIIIDTYILVRTILIILVIQRILLAYGFMLSWPPTLPAAIWPT